MSSAKESTGMHILRMPNEILRLFSKAVADLDCALPKGYKYYNTHYSREPGTRKRSERRGRVQVEGRYALALTCKRFHASVTPVLYEKVSIDVWLFWEAGAPQQTCFLRSIRENPALQVHIRYLELGNIRSPDAGTTAALLASPCEFPHLESLSIKGMYSRGDYQPFDSFTQIKGSANFTHLELKRIRARPESIKKLLKITRSLNTFTLDHMTYDGYDWDDAESDPAYRWSHAKLTDVLMPQRESLRVLKLGWMGYTLDQNTFKGSLFPALQTLSLCIAYEPPTLEACRNWLTPNLKTLILDFHRNDSQCGPVCSFENKGFDIITKVASWAQTLKSETELGLENIGIRIYTDEDEWDEWTAEDEWSCVHGGRDGDDQAMIISALKKMKECGFNTYWIGSSGIKHTPEMLETYCKCDSKPLVSTLEDYSESSSGEWQIDVSSVREIEIPSSLGFT